MKVSFRRHIVHFTKQPVKQHLSISVGILASIGLVVSAISVAFQPHPAQAIEADGFACDGTFYQSRGVSGTGARIYRINRDTTPYTSTALTPGTLNGTNLYNGLAYSPLTGYLHLWQIGTHNFVTINNSGTIIKTDNITTATVSNMQGATMDENGIYYSMTDGNNVSTLLRINTTILPTPTFTSQALTVLDPGTIRGVVGDLAIDPADPNTIYVTTGQDIGNGITNSYLNKINLTAGTYEVVGNLSVGSTPVNIGTSFFDSAGTLYAYSNAGQFYQVNKATGALTSINATDAASVSDGASCGFEPVNIDTVKSLVTANAVDSTTFNTTFRLAVGNNSGNAITANNVQITEALTRTFTSGSPVITVPSPPTLISGPCTINSTFNGTSDTRILAGSDDLADGQSCVIQFTAHLVYPTSASVPTVTQYNTTYASSTATGPNPGYTFNSDGDPTPPIGLLTADVSTNSTSIPPVPGGTDTPSSTPITLPSTPAAPPVDPPSGYKTFNANGLPQFTWKMVWLNSDNASPLRTRIVDPIDTATPYIAGSLACDARGSSTTTSCTYDSSTNSIIWEGVLGSDLGATDEASAANEIVITFNVTLPSSLTHTANQGRAFWDQNNDSVLDTTDQNIQNNTPVLTGNGTNITTGLNQPTVFTRTPPPADPADNDQLAATGLSQLSILGMSGFTVTLGVLLIRLRRGIA